MSFFLYLWSHLSPKGAVFATCADMWRWEITSSDQLAVRHPVKNPGISGLNTLTAESSSHPQTWWWVEFHWHLGFFHRCRKAVERAHWVAKSKLIRFVMHKSSQHARSLHSEWVFRWFSVFGCTGRMTVYFALSLISHESEGSHLLIVSQLYKLVSYFGDEVYVRRVLFLQVLL